MFEDYEYANIKFYFSVHSSDDFYNMKLYLDYDGHNYNWETNYPGPTPFKNTDPSAVPTQPTPTDSIEPATKPSEDTGPLSV